MSALVIVQRYDGESREQRTFVEVEQNEGEVDVILNPFTDAAETISLDIDETWKLIRKLAECATLAQSED